MALFLVLAIQLLQAQSVLVSDARPSCLPQETASCGCCKGADHCPCAKSSPSQEKQSPLSLLPESAKAQDFIKPSCETPTLELPVGIQSLARAPAAGDGQATGYRGVSLAVAFCTFLI